MSRPFRASLTHLVFGWVDALTPLAAYTAWQRLTLEDTVRVALGIPSVLD